MADDQNKVLNPIKDAAPSTIDDLVKQLSSQNGQKTPSPASTQPSSPAPSAITGQKPLSPPLSGGTMTSKEPPPNLPGIKIGSKPPMPPETAPLTPSKPAPGGLTVPPIMPAQPIQPSPSRPPVQAMPMPPQPSAGPMKSALGQMSAAPSVPKPPTPPLPPQPQSSKQLVQEYRSSIRTMGEDISSIKSGQKPLGVDIPRKVTPEMPQPTTLQPKPAAPQSTITVPSVVGLGKAEKTGPLQIPSMPQKPAEPPKPPTIQPSITVPTERKSNWTFYAIIAGIIVIGGALYWFLIMRTTIEPELVLSPTPTQTVTPTPTVKGLQEILAGDSQISFEVVSNETLANDFKIFAGSLNVARGEFLQINLVEATGEIMTSLNFLDLLDKSLALYPAELRDNATDSVFLAYGQSESFNPDGSANLDNQNLKKISFVAKVSDRTAVETAMRDWESLLADDLADYLLISDTSKEASADFLDNAYREVPIRYKNFPFADVTIDYAIFNVDGQAYLIISSSREAMYASIDAVLNQ